MHRTGKTNAKSGPEKYFNAYREFHDRELQAHILASFMVFAGMTKQTGIKLWEAWQANNNNHYCGNYNCVVCTLTHSKL